VELEKLNDDQLAYFAIFNWVNDNRPYPFPVGGYTYEVAATRDRFLQELYYTGRDAFIEKHKIKELFNPKRGIRKMAWTDEKKAEVVKMYLEAEPTPETSVEIVKEIAEKVEETPNGVRMILSKAEVYVKKEAGAAASSGTTKSSGTTRVSKSDSIQGLKDVIAASGQTVNDEVLDKLTGKQAVYLTEVMKTLIK
jgi:transposase-like protein